MLRVRQGTAGLGSGALVVFLVVAFAGCCGSSGKPSAGGAASASSAPAGFQRPGAGKPPVTLGTKNFTEEFILGQLYARALRARGFSITLKSNIGPSERVDRELISDRIDGYP